MTLVICTFFVLLVLIILGIVVYLNSELDYEELKQAVVIIYVFDGDELISSGSGVIAISDDILLTNMHVIESAVENSDYHIEVITENNYRIEVLGILGYSKSNDYAILKIDNSANIEPLSISVALEEIGNDIITIGSPFGIINTISTGIISNYDDSEYERYIFTAPVSSGSSGGALLNDDGDLIGLVYSTIQDGQNLNFAIPIKNIYNKYLKVMDNDAIVLVYADDLYKALVNDGTIFEILQYLYEIDNIPGIKSYSGDDLSSSDGLELISNTFNFTEIITLSRGAQLYLNNIDSYYRIEIYKSDNISDYDLNDFQNFFELNDFWETPFVFGISYILDELTGELIVEDYDTSDFYYEYGKVGDYFYRFIYKDIEFEDDIIEMINNLS